MDYKTGTGSWPHAEFSGRITSAGVAAGIQKSRNMQGTIKVSAGNSAFVKKDIDIRFVLQEPMDESTFQGMTASKNVRIEGILKSGSGIDHDICPGCGSLSPHIRESVYIVASGITDLDSTDSACINDVEGDFLVASEKVLLNRINGKPEYAWQVRCIPGGFKDDPHNNPGAFWIRQRINDSELSNHIKIAKGSMLHIKGFLQLFQASPTCYCRFCGRKNRHHLSSYDIIPLEVTEIC